MITIGNHEEKLVNEFPNFKNQSIETLNNVITGLNLAKELSDSPKESTKISDVINKLSHVEEILSSFKIGITSTTNPEKLWLVWEETGSSKKYYYNDEKELTEKMFCFLLMSLEKEISQRLSVVEDSFSGYIYFSSKIKDWLHKIIVDYMTT